MFNSFSFNILPDSSWKWFMSCLPIVVTIQSVLGIEIRVVSAFAGLIVCSIRALSQG